MTTLSRATRHMPLEDDQTDSSRTLAASADSRNRCAIRPMIESDLEAVLEIEQQTWGRQSWDLHHFVEEFNDPSHSCWILEDLTNTHHLIGYGIQYAGPDRESHITNLTLRASERGRGLGGVLLRHMIDHARRIYALSITLEVDTSNQPALILYTNHGFRIVRHLPGYYSNDNDAYDMQLLL